MYSNSLNTKQILAESLYLQGKNLFITGPAGVGKTFLIKHLKSLSLHTGKKVAVTALTGCAAFLIGGKTIHSWSGIGLGKQPVEKLISRIKNNKRNKFTWLRTQVLVIDEISMMTAELLEKLEQIARKIKNNNLPFGGIQIVFLGDFCQLPPIEKDKGGFCFESHLWNELFDQTIYLDEIMRQSDPVFQEILNKIRLGVCDENCIESLNTCLYPEKKYDSSEDEGIDHKIIPTKLFTLNQDVNSYNDFMLKRLKTKVHKFNAKTEKIKNELDEDLTLDQIEKIEEFMDKNGNYMKDLKLAIGCQVVLLINMDTDLGLVNGARGIVTGFSSSNDPIVKFNNGEIKIIEKYNWIYEENENQLIERIQYPLKLAWAISIHKSQGMSMDLVEIDIGESIFEYGQSYVALSRVKTLEGLYISKFQPKNIKINPLVKDYYNKLSNEQC